MSLCVLRESVNLHSIEEATATEEEDKEEMVSKNEETEAWAMKKIVKTENYCNSCCGRTRV